jgi:hypothetical protein
MIITNSNRKAFLKTQPFAYQSGWLAAEDTSKNVGRDTYPCSLPLQPQNKVEWNAGYEACMNNSFTAEGQITEPCAL